MMFIPPGIVRDQLWGLLVSLREKVAMICESLVGDGELLLGAGYSHSLLGCPVTLTCRGLVRWPCVPGGVAVALPRPVQRFKVGTT
jgi:hypothetical protein